MDNEASCVDSGGEIIIIIIIVKFLAPFESKNYIKIKVHTHQLILSSIHSTALTFVRTRTFISPHNARLLITWVINFPRLRPTVLI